MLQSLPKTIGISEVRQNASLFFKEVNQADEPRFVLVNNKLQAVVLNPDLYQSLMEAWQDQQDAVFLDKRISESDGKFYTFDQVDKMRA